jgi:hypothetical protein
MPPKTLDLPPNALLQRAISEVLDGREVGHGVICPCCEQKVTLHKRIIYSTMTRALAILYEHAKVNGGNWLHFPSYARGRKLGTLGQGGDWAKLALWNLIELADGRREDGSVRTGEARITEDGRRFCERRHSVRRVARVYNDELVRFEGPMIKIDATLGKKFSYADLFPPG